MQITALEANHNYSLEDVLSEMEKPKKIVNDNTPQEDRIPIFDRKTSPRLIELKAKRMELWERTSSPSFMHDFMELTRLIDEERQVVKAVLK
jgi:hypothetical protein